MRTKVWNSADMALAADAALAAVRIIENIDYETPTTSSVLVTLFQRVDARCAAENNGSLWDAVWEFYRSWRCKSATRAEEAVHDLMMEMDREPPGVTTEVVRPVDPNRKTIVVENDTDRPLFVDAEGRVLPGSFQEGPR